MTEGSFNQLYEDHVTKKLFVRFSTSADEGAIFQYYKDNPSPFVFARDPAVWHERFSSGAATLIEDEAGAIQACAIAYPVKSQAADGTETHRWTEIGSVTVAKKNTGLFEHLVSAHVMRAWMLEPPEDRFILDIFDANTHSKHVFGKAGATLYENMPPELAGKVMATVVKQGAPKLDWYQIGPEAMPGFARRVLDAAAGTKLVDKATQEEYALDYSRCVLVTSFSDALRETAGRDFGDAAKPDYSKGIGHYKRTPGAG